MEEGGRIQISFCMVDKIADRRDPLVAQPKSQYGMHRESKQPGGARPARAGCQVLVCQET